MNKNMHLLAALSQQLNVDLQLESGVCALFDSHDQEVCVIELLRASQTHWITGTSAALALSIICRA